jgi:hypothetical protein
VCIEQLDELGEVGKRSGQAIDFLDHDDIDLFGSNQGLEAFGGRAGPGKRLIGRHRRMTSV